MAKSRKKQQPVILITNDDGVTAPGIRNLVESVRDLGKIVVVAPDKPQSGMGHAITIGVPLRLHPISLFEGIETWQCCQEERPGQACIEFPGTVEVTKFLWIAQRRYKVEVETWDEGEKGQHSIQARLLVFFPTRDINRLVEAFCHHLTSERGQ